MKSAVTLYCLFYTHCPSQRRLIINLKVPIAVAQVTLLSDLSRGRSGLNTGQYRPHIVIGSQSQREAVRSGNTFGLAEDYLGVMFVGGPESLSPGETAVV